MTNAEAEDLRARQVSQDKRIRREQAYAKGVAAKLAGASVEAIVLAVSDAVLFSVDWSRVAEEATRRQLQFDELIVKRRSARARKAASEALQPMLGELTPEQYLEAWTRYKRFAKREKKALDEQDRIWARWDALLARDTDAGRKETRKLPAPRPPAPKPASPADGPHG